MPYVDPTKYRLSDNLLLSDLMGCDSVYRYGYLNRIRDSEVEKLEEAANLARYLEFLGRELGPFSISYGYICPELSQKIVTYQDPNKPSYHRFELGAAADVCFHDRNVDNPPIDTAYIIDGLVEYSRMITYAESEFICFAVKKGENPARKAFYENRYTGKNPPLHIKYPQKNRKQAKIAQIEAFNALEVDWRGQGWPSYHGKGRKQFHHIRLGEYCFMSDFLYNRDKVHAGERNLPPLTAPKKMENWYKSAQMAADTLDLAISTLGNRVSVIRAFNSDNPRMDWQQRFTLELDLHSIDNASKVGSMLEKQPFISVVQSKGTRLLIAGEYL